MLALAKIFVLGLFIHTACAISNPIISGWNPDPAIIRLGDDYYIATSSFEYFPGMPIYKSTDLQNWELFSHALSRSSQVQLWGTPTGAGVWAPSLSHINGKVYIAAMTRWTYDPVARVWPRIMWISSSDMKEWSDPIWGELWGIDPQLFQDPENKKVYLNVMAPNNNEDRLWGIYQCEVNIDSGNCIGEYRSLWNGTLPHTKDARPEGPKMFWRSPYYYLVIAEGGTDYLHRASVARSSSPTGPWEPAPNGTNPLIYNGAYGFNNLTVQSTGHPDMIETSDGRWYASFIARRTINTNISSPLGRESFLCSVNWNDDDWPVFNDGKPILLTESFGEGTAKVGRKKPLRPFIDTFDSHELDKSWYRLRSPYTDIYRLDDPNRGNKSGITLLPNVFTLSERDTPAALFRKQKSLNMTFSATLKEFRGDRVLGPRQSVGISAYLSELQHQDIGVRGCANATGLCLYTQLLRNGTKDFSETPLNMSKTKGTSVTLHIRATPTEYSFGFSIGDSISSTPELFWLESVSASWLAFAPPGYFVFTGASFAIFASGNAEPWPYDAPEVGFSRVEESYGKDYVKDYQ
ncbi:beta-xylosidase [Corynespora cassiicola Philippines]|uniref:Beta-xylosidase n=1 Tax=Corynespora cassiicola Philippines TaxID=1448308 RepID=A0A2T2P087_CORCC|nr:beta-xylosidase [Corynespora cassiicola Philippines]